MRGRAGVILCGGRSSRMGCPKHLLLLDGQTFLERCYAAMDGIVDEVVVSLGAGQEPPPLPPGAWVSWDDVVESGPLAGIASTMARLSAEHVAIISCDAPLVRPQLLEFLFQFVGDHDAALAVVGGRRQFFPGVYRRALGALARSKLDSGRRSMTDFTSECRIRLLSEDDVSAYDPALDSFRNINTPEAYATLVGTP